MPHANLQTLADAAEAVCRREGIQPVNGQAAEELSVRTLRYYRTLGVLDGPDGEGYGEKHLAQLIAIRVLQSMGQSLRRVQVLLAGRSLADLRKIHRDGVGELKALSPAASRWPTQNETWAAAVVDAEWVLLSRSGRTASPAELAQIRAVLQPDLKLPAAAHH